MANRSYNPTGNPSFRASGSSALIRQEFANVSAGFASMEGELDGKPNLSGSSSYSGTHDYRNAVLKAKRGVANEDVATMADVVNAAIATQLPGQGGYAGCFIRTDGTSATWYDLFLSRLATTSISSLVYNSDSTLASLTYATGEKEIYAYTSGNLTQIQYTGTDGVTVKHTESLSYDGSGNLSAITWS